MTYVTSIGLDVHARSASACAFDHTAFPPGGPALRHIAGVGSRPFLWAARGPRPITKTQGLSSDGPWTENRNAVARGDII